MSKRFRVPLGVLAALIAAAAVAAEPSAHQIYLATRAGHITQAEHMIAEVLRAHPNSAKAHFVAAEVQARAGNFGIAREQLARARSLEPALSFASPRAVRELETELGMASAHTSGVRAPHRSHLGWALLLIGGVIVVWALVRRRMAAYRPPGQMYPPGMTPGPMGTPPGTYPPGAYPPGAGPGYPRGGSGIMGNIASGLAIGAGVAAGEALVDHVLDGNAGSAGVIPDANAASAIDPPANADMGGENFGLNDPGSWGDGGGGGLDDGGGGGWDSGGGDGGWT